VSQDQRPPGGSFLPEGGEYRRPACGWPYYWIKACLQGGGDSTGFQRGASRGRCVSVNPITDRHDGEPFSANDLLSRDGFYSVRRVAQTRTPGRVSGRGFQARLPRCRTMGATRRRAASSIARICGWSAQFDAFGVVDDVFEKSCRIVPPKIVCQTSKVPDNVFRGWGKRQQPV